MGEVTTYNDLVFSSWGLGGVDLEVWTWRCGLGHGQGRGSCCSGG